MPISLICQNCGKEYTRKPCFAAKSKACSKQCLGVIQRTESKGKVFAPNSPILWANGEKNPMWKGGISEPQAWKHRGDTCERCGSKRFICIHHKDENRANNDPSNLETVCKKCHQTHHAEPRRDPATGRYARLLD